MTEYQNVVTREGGWWLAAVKGLEGAVTEARTLAALDRRVREVVALVEDLPAGAEGGLEVGWEFHTGDPEIDDFAAALRVERRRIVAAEIELAEQTVDLARRLRRNWSVRDVAALLGVSPQRISQIAPDDRPARRGRKRRAA